MPAHSRRRVSTCAIFLSLLFLFASTASAASAVLGIDLGTEYIKAALVKPGIPLEIVLTKDSKRKETAAVAFKPLRTRVSTAESNDFPERIYGGDAVALSARFPSDVYPNLKPLLGLKSSDHLVSEYGGTFPGLDIVEWAETGTVGFKSDSFSKEEEPWLVEELLAMELKNIKGNAEAMAGKGSTIQDTVITVPSFYTAEERRAVTLAADLAGLRVLSLISDGLSVGLNYATSRTFPTVNQGGKPEIHLVYDMGAGSTTATVLKFQGRTVKDVGKYNKTIQEVQVLGTSWDKTFGGNALNRVILEDMISQITSTDHMVNLEVLPKHVWTHGRTMAKLWKEAERVRQVLSANTEISTSLESLYDEDFNFKYKLSRAEFERLASAYLERVQQPITEALEVAKLSLADLESVILHGGAVRTPFVQRTLEAVIQDSDKIRTNVNADEAAVFGAAFKAAAISPSFRVKEIRASDSAVYPVTASWSIDGKGKQQKLFVPTSQVGSEKQVSVKATADFSFTLSQQPSSGPSELQLSVMKTENLTDSVKHLTTKFGCPVNEVSTKFAIRLSPVDGLPEVTGGSVSCEVTETEAKKGGVVDGMKDFLGFGSKKGDQEPLKEDGNAESSTSTSESEASTASLPLESNTPGPVADEIVVEEKPKELKKKTETIAVGFSTESVGSQTVSPDSQKRMKARLDAFDKSDRSRVLREETLNNLEGYTYRIRDILEDEGFVAASTEEQRDGIEEKSNDASIWLYGDGADASRESLKARLDELRVLVAPIQKRKEEASKRPSEIQKLKDALAQAETMVTVVKQQREAQKLAESKATSDSEGAKSPTTTAPSISTDDFADLDDETATVSSSTTSAAPDLPASVYSDEDVNAIVQKEDDVKQWLDEKLAEQEKLSPTDDPILLSSELAAKSKELNDLVMSLLTKQMKTPPKPKRSKSKSKSTRTSATKATDAGTSAEESGKAAKETTGPAGGLDDEMEGSHQVTQEEIDEAMAEQKSRAERKPTKKDKAKASGKGKGKGKPSGKDKKKAEEHGEL
ncbi:lumenal Hsp70 protein [Imshaugia aleurites]|uniref:Lumenal Hsp70 protein n=1 Tax=Imshaugia aleurites TaxID=172621 RepID=A0A8H3IPL7_9LECA|nr:lumenal Hsp70 protein [Imshaugia aleurites]